MQVNDRSSLQHTQTQTKVVHCWTGKIDGLLYDCVFPYREVCHHNFWVIWKEKRMINSSLSLVVYSLRYQCCNQWVSSYTWWIWGLEVVFYPASQESAWSRRCWAGSCWETLCGHSEPHPYLKSNKDQHWSFSSNQNVTVLSTSKDCSAKSVSVLSRTYGGFQW